MWELISHAVTAVTPQNVCLLVLFGRVHIFAKSIH